MNIDSIFGPIAAVASALVKLGGSLVLLFLVVDVIDPGRTDIVANLSGLINQFMDAGLAGLVAFIVVVALFYRPFIVAVAIVGRPLYRVYRKFRR